MIPSECYAPLRLKAVAVPDFISWVLEQEPEWEEHFGFNAIELPLELVRVEPALRELDQIWQIGRLGLLEVGEMSVYDWHVDQYRLSCVNMLYSIDNTSHTLFGSQRDHLNKDVIELKYEPNTFYLFNNQVPHTVINLDGPRFLFSLYFREELDYSKLKALYDG